MTLIMLMMVAALMSLQSSYFVLYILTYKMMAPLCFVATALPAVSLVLNLACMLILAL